MVHFQTGIPLLDQHLQAAHPSFVLLGARPGVGKTTLALQMALAMLTRGERVVYFSAELPRAEVTERLAAAIVGVPLGSIMAGELTADQRQLVEDSSRTLLSQLTIDDTPQLTFRHVRDVLAAADAAGEPVANVVIDYVQLMDAGNYAAAKLGALGDNLRGLAQEFDCNVLALAQVARGGDMTADGGLKLSTAMAQAADVILSVRELRSLTVDRRVAVRVIKNRHGLSGDEVGLVLRTQDRQAQVIMATERPAAQVEMYRRVNTMLEGLLTTRGRELWWQASNTHLGGEAPLALLEASGEHQVLRAAKSFLVELNA